MIYFPSCVWWPPFWLWLCSQLLRWTLLGYDYAVSHPNHQLYITDGLYFFIYGLWLFERLWFYIYL